MRKIRLQKRTWTLGQEVGSGGFGRIVEAESDGMGRWVAKLVPKDPGAQREILFVALNGVRNVVPVIDSGEIEDHWILVMPRAECSLRDRLNDAKMTEKAIVGVMTDVTNALLDLNENIVHRDIKPENTLLLDDRWCLSDFGISRYVEASTAKDTRKHALTATYAAPERWRIERATTASDVYSLGVMSYEMLSGSPPFRGTREELRDAHLHGTAPVLVGVPHALSALVMECIAKPSGARPRVEELVDRLRKFRATEKTNTPEGLKRLEESNLEEVVRQRKKENEESELRSAIDRRTELFQFGSTLLQEISSAVFEAIRASASAAESSTQGTEWTIKLREANLCFGSPIKTAPNPWNWDEPAFSVIAHSQISLNIPRRQDFDGRSHSLWYCDAHESGRYQWFETAFMVSPLIPRRGITDPFALNPGEEAAEALCMGVGTHQVAWPFEVVPLNSLEAFIDRWAGWLADAASGRLNHPSEIPERPIKDTWRR